MENLVSRGARGIVLDKYMRKSCTARETRAAVNIEEVSLEGLGLAGISTLRSRAYLST